MSKYIDAEKLIAKLKRQKRELELSIQSQGDYGQSCQIVAYENIISLIPSLQQESTPSKEEVADRIADWISRNPDFFFNGDIKEVMNEIRKLV